MRKAKASMNNESIKQLAERDVMKGYDGAAGKKARRLPGQTPRVIGANEPQSKFWEVRGVAAVLNGLRGQNGNVAIQTAIVHIMRSLQDIEAVLESSCHAYRCNHCGVMVWNDHAIAIFGTRFCMECGTAEIELQVEDDNIKAGLAKDLACQAENSRFPLGLYHAYEEDHPFRCYWNRIALALPEFGVAWQNLRERRA